METKNINKFVTAGAAGNRESCRFSFCRHPEFISGSSRFNGKDKMLKQVQHDVVEARGFTLIELLVVVLIIGILAAVAVPQYQVAVEKSKAAILEAVINKLAQAEEVYYLANGEYTTDLSALDIEIPKEYNCTMEISTTNFISCAQKTTTSVYTLHVCLQHQPSNVAFWAGKQRCWATTSIHKQVCASLGYRLSTESSESIWVYNK